MRRVLNGRSVVILDGKEVLAPWCLLGGAFRRHRVGGAEFVDIHRASVSSPEMYGVHSGGQDDEHASSGQDGFPSGLSVASPGQNHCTLWLTFKVGGGAQASRGCKGLRNFDRRSLLDWAVTEALRGSVASRACEHAFFP